MKFLKLMLFLAVALGLLVAALHYLAPGEGSILDRGLKVFGPEAPVGDDLRPQDRKELDDILNKLPE